MAEMLYNHLFHTDSASSAGTDVTVGKPLHPDVIATLERHFLKPEKLFRKELTKEAADTADKIILMTKESVPAYLENNPKVVYWDIDDPRDKGIKVHEEVYNEIKEKVKFLPHD